jgi:hypothetical protein
MQEALPAILISLGYIWTIVRGYLKQTMIIRIGFSFSRTALLPFLCDQSVMFEAKCYQIGTHFGGEDSLDR